MTYTFIHAFKDGTLGKCWMRKATGDREDIHFDIKVPQNKPKRWHNEFLRWMEDSIILKAEELENNVEVEFEFTQQ